MHFAYPLPWWLAAILAAAIGAISQSESQFTDRLWHTSNTNTVASRAFIRPLVTASR